MSEIGKAELVPGAVPALPPAQEMQHPEGVADAKNYFAPFLKNNPLSDITVLKIRNKERVVIEKPWGDASFVLAIPPNDSEELQEALNNVYLPARFTALWHFDTKSLEVIWTAFPLTGAWKEVNGRKFAFRFNGTEYECEFGRSSNRLLTIAHSYHTITSSNTFFRNLESFHMYSRLFQKRPEFQGEIPVDPLSFWIRGVDWNEDAVLALSNNLNFYLSYYDNISPRIIIHTFSDVEAPRPQTRYPAGAFPGIIDGRPIDDVLLQLWTASRSADEANRILYCFRIIEFASYSYVDGKARREIRRILSDPIASDNLGRVTERVVESLKGAALTDWNMTEALLEDTVRPEILWREISDNLEAFNSVVKFDGNFVLKPLIPKEATETSYQVKAIENFHRAIRDIRNALAHGKDEKSAGVIVPTVKNFERLRPWAALISVAAGEVMIYKNVA